MPVLRSKVEPKGENSGKSSKCSTPAKSDTSKTSRTSGIKKRKLSDTESNSIEKSEMKSSKTSNSTSPNKGKQSKGGAEIKLCVVNEEKSHFHNGTVVKSSKTEENILESNCQNTEEKGSDEILISDEELDFDDYKITHHKKKVPMIVVSDSD